MNDDIKVVWGDMVPVAHVKKIVDVKIKKRYTTHHYLLLFPLWYNPVESKSKKVEPPIFKKYKKNTNDNVRNVYGNIQKIIDESYLSIIRCIKNKIIGTNRSFFICGKDYDGA